MKTETSPQPRVAFIGLGLMGSGMAHRLLAAGFPLTVYNRNPARSAPLAAAGAQVAASPREAASGAQVVFSMVADDAISQATWLGENGALAGAARGAVLIESSTLTVPWTEKLAAAAAARGCEFLDAPVTGSKPQAASGELILLIGGTAAVIDKVRPVLAAVSKAVVHLGPTGSGVRMKLINNFLSGVQAASLTEAWAMIERSGLDRAKAVDVITNGAPGSPMIRTMAARVAAPDYDNPNFMLRLMAKDLSYAAEEGRRHGVQMVTAASAHAVFQQAIDSGLGNKDLSAVIESLQGKGAKAAPAAR